MSNSLLFLPDLFCYSCNLIPINLILDPDCDSEMTTLHTMKPRRLLVALSAVALLLAVLIIVIIYKFYISNH